MSDYPAGAPAQLIRWVMLRTGSGPVRPLWRFLYAVLMKSVALALRAGAPVSTVYVRGSFALREPVYGLSDVDLIAVVRDDAGCPGANGRRLRERVRRAYRAVPLLKDVVEITVFEEHELAETVRVPFLASGPDANVSGSLPRARFFSGNPAVRPDTGARLYGPLRPRWRAVLGQDMLTRLPLSPPAYRWLWAWADVQFNWKHVFRACADPSLPRTAYHCAKFVALPVRLWLWLVHGERVLGGQAELLQRGLRVMPEDERMLRTALALQRDASRSPTAPLTEVLAWLVGMTSRLAQRLAAECEAAGGTEVRLLRDAGTEPIISPQAHDRLETLLGGHVAFLPLVDWRAVVLPDLPDEAFALVPGDPGNPGVLGRTARAGEAGPYPAFVHSGLLLLPSASSGLLGLGRCSFRAVQCPPTDPVSFAVVAGRDGCRFPNVPGWSAREQASRALAEHGAWLAAPADDSPIRRLGMLLSASRAALFFESVERGEPELPVTVGAAARCLGGAAEDAWEDYRACRLMGAEPNGRAVEALEKLVHGLPVYKA